MRVMIVDDEPLAVERLQLLVKRTAGVELAGTACDGEQALRLLPELNPEVLLLDIEMPGMDGFALIEALGRDAAPAIIFVTAFDRFAIRAFDVAAIDYLVKPVEQSRLQQALERARIAIDSRSLAERFDALQAAVGQMRADPERDADNNFSREFWVPQRSEMVRVLVDDIDWIEAERDYMRLHVGERSYLLHETISGLEERLDPNRFARLHRSALVRIDRIVRMKRNSYGAWSAELASGKTVRVGRKYLNRAREIIDGANRQND